MGSATHTVQPPHREDEHAGCLGKLGDLGKLGVPGDQGGSGKGNSNFEGDGRDTVTVAVSIRNFKVSIPAVGEDDLHDRYVKLVITQTDGGEHSEVLSLADLGDDLRGAFRLLRRRGLVITSREDRAEIAELFNELPPPTFKVVRFVGWTNGHFALPDRIYGPDKVSFEFRLRVAADIAKWGRRGTLRRWRRYAKRLLPGNHVMILIVVMAFSGPLLKILNHPSFGVMLVGKPASGKTTTNRYGGSIWGGSDRHLGFCESPRKTPNSVERAWERHNDGFLPFDDTKALGANFKARAEWLEEVMFMLEQGAAKDRLSEVGLPFQGRVAFILTSNESLETLFAGAGKPLDESHRTRLIEIPTDGRHGAFDDFHGLKSKEFCAEVERASRAAYGTPIRRFLKRLTEEFETNRTELIKRLRTYAEELVSNLPIDQSGPAQRTAKVFGTIYAAGRLAINYGILPLSKEDLQASVIQFFKRHQAFTGSQPVQVSADIRIARYISRRHSDFLDARKGRVSISDEDFVRARGIILDARPGVRYAFAPERFHRIFGDESEGIRAARSEDIWLQIERRCRPNLPFATPVTGTVSIA